MKYSSRIKAVLAAGMAAAFCFTLSAPWVHAVSQDDIDRLQGEIDAKQEEIDAIADKTASNQEYLDALSEQLRLATEKLEMTQNRIDELNAQIAEKQQKIDETYAQLATRLRSMYMNNSTSPLEMLFSAQDYSTFLMSMELVSRTSEYDSKMIREFKDLIDRQNEDKKELEEQKAVEEADQQAMQKKVDDQKAILAQLESDSAAAQKIQQQLYDQMDAYEEEIRRQASSGSSGGGNYTGGIFTWPVADSSAYISSYYGPRTDPYTGFHGGIDFTCSGAMGKSLYAAGSGTVIYVNSTNTWGSGWGYHIIIDHGDGLTTLYAHMGSVAVSVGETVSQGQYIGTIGMTGNTYGPHCHLEVRINGDRTNPAPYFGL